MTVQFIRVSLLLVLGAQGVEVTVLILIGVADQVREGVEVLV